MYLVEINNEEFRDGLNTRSRRARDDISFVKGYLIAVKSSAASFLDLILITFINACINYTRDDPLRISGAVVLILVIIV